ncbi:MAG TPA: hypothetical protein VNM34_14770, partial [Verrucomicrobiae bacterium]|nr:hypothetical protein [Verrucomicrobiae bacterium]
MSTSCEPPQRREHRLGHPRLPAAPLYDAAFEHDACGVGFVADASPRGIHLDRVLPLALGGLAALAHRGAFGADGASSDGAGVSLPLDPSLIESLTPRSGLAASRPGIVQLFLPRTGAGARGGRARSLMAAVFGEEGLEIVRWRSVPADPDALGGAARACRPAFVQAFVGRPDGGDGRPLGDAAFERRLVLARRRLETAAREAGL